MVSKGRSAIESVHLAVMVMEDNPVFNAGVGSALNEKGEVQMEAAIMDGKYLNSASVALVNQIKNPISLAKAIMENSNHTMIAGQAAIRYAVKHGMMPDVGIIISAQKVGHYEIAAYGGLTTLAKTMNREDVAEILAETLAVEKETDQLLTEIAESHINYAASSEEEA